MLRWMSDLSRFRFFVFAWTQELLTTRISKRTVRLILPSPRYEDIRDNMPPEPETRRNISFR
jgi:hypothetical protein